MYKMMINGQEVNGSVPVDQQYNPNSENAQSGKAINGALTNYLKYKTGTFNFSSVAGSKRIDTSSITGGTLPDTTLSRAVSFTVVGNSNVNNYWINLHYDGTDLYCASNVAQTNISVRWVQFLI